MIQSTIEKYIQEPVIYVEQKEPLGTGDAVKSCLSYLSLDEKVIILSGDVPLITSETIQELISKTKSCGIIVAHVKNPKGLGRVILKHHSFSGASPQWRLTSTEIHSVSRSRLCASRKILEDP